MLLRNDAAGFTNVFRLVAKEAGPANQVFQFRRIPFVMEGTNGKLLFQDKKL